MNFVLVFGLVAASLRSVYGALSDDDRAKIHSAIIPYVVECSKEHSISDDEIKSAKESGHLGGINPCFLGCIFKKVKVIDDKGLLDFDVATKLVQKYVSQKGDQAKIAEIIDKCKSVNDKNVSDGEKGCERARLIYQCALPFKTEFLKSVS